MAKSKATPDTPVQPKAPATITVDRRLFQSELAWISKFIEKKAIIPILRNVCLRSKDGVLALAGTDLEIGARTSFEGEKRFGDFEITVAAEDLLTYLTTLPKARVKKGTKNSGDYVTLTKTADDALTLDACGSLLLPAMSVESFPLMPWPDNPPDPFIAPQTPGEAIFHIKTLGDIADPVLKQFASVVPIPEVSEGELADIVARLSEAHYAALRYSRVVDVIGLQTAIKRTVNAISAEESRFTLNGALFDFKEGDNACLVATDGHRLALAKCVAGQQGTEEFKNTLIPKRAMVHIDNTFTDSPIRLSVNANHLHFQQAGDPHEILARKLTGNFPDYERVLPKDYPNTVNIPVDELKQALAQVIPFADKRSHIIHFGIEHAELTLWAQTERGRRTADVPLPSNGVTLVTGFNATYILDALNVLPKDQEYVAFTFKTGNDSGVFKIRDFTNVIMPCRV
jgi:DNA polymerase III sliding clamp (beta) subunit (PCNA family)